MDNANVNHTIQQIGTALVAYGTVQAQFDDGGVRVIETNSPLFLNDRITTDANGMITIVFNDTAGTQLDLGQMADVLLNEDVFQETTPADLSDAVAEAEQIREALSAGGFDPITAEAASDGGEGDDVLIGGEIALGAPGESDIVVDHDADTFSGSFGHEKAGDAHLDYTADTSVENAAPDIDTLISPPEDV